MKYIFSLLLWCLLLFSSVSAQIPDDTFFYGDTYSNDPSTSFGTLIKDDVVTDNAGVLKRTLITFNLDQFIVNSDAGALELIKYILNIALSLIAFVALIVIIYGFTQVLFAKDDEAITTARKTIQWAAIAIAIAASSFFIISFLFELYNRFVT